MTYQGLNQARILNAVEDDGTTLRLDDHSCWNVYQGFAVTCSTWSAGDMINVKSSRDPEYPYKLINIHKNQSVEARLLP